VHCGRAQGVDVASATGKKTWLKFVAGSPFGWQLRQLVVSVGTAVICRRACLGDDLCRPLSLVTAAAGLLLEICRPRSVGPDRAVTRQARHLVMDGSGADTERRVRRDRRHMVGGVVTTAIGTCESAWHFRQSPDVSLGVVNFRSLTATCTGAMADCACTCAIDPSRDRPPRCDSWWQAIAPGRCTAGAPSAWTSVWVMGNNG